MCLGLNVGDIFAFKGCLQLSRGSFDIGLDLAINLITILNELFLGLVDQGFAIVFRFDQFFTFFVSFGISLGILHHIIDLIFVQATIGLNGDLLLFASAFVFG